MLVLLAFITCLMLGFWQFSRLSERKDLNSRIESRMNESTVDISKISDMAVEKIEYRRVSISGKFLESSDVLVAGRSLEGEPGYNLLTALLINEEDVVFINRGWISLPLGEAIKNQTADENVTSPVGGFDEQVEIIGLVQKNESKRLIGTNSKVNENNFVSTRLDAKLFINRNEQVKQANVYGFWVQEQEQLIDGKKIERKEFPRILPKPELTERNHFSYAMQWLIFGFVAVITWIVICVNALKKEKRRENNSVTK